MSLRDRRTENRREASIRPRLYIAFAVFVIGFLVIAGRLFQLQVLEYPAYRILASDQHETEAQLVPKRGSILLQDRFDGSMHPVATDRDVWQVFAVPREIKDVETTALTVASSTGLSVDDLRRMFSVPTGTYQVIAKDVPMEQAQMLQMRRMPGIGVNKGLSRFYPEQGLGGHIFGFVATNDAGKRVGRYGIEGAYQDELAGTYGSILTEKDAKGTQLSIGTTNLVAAKDGADIVLTIDRTIQYEACRRIENAVKEFEAESGTIIVLDPDTGAVLAMCSSPDYEPANFGKIESISVLNNPATFDQFEPGSIFKPLTMAAGIDAGKITPSTTYEDKGEEKIDDFTIRNSDKLGHGIQTMTEVLKKSLNTGTIFVERLLGKELFREYVKRFGFGEKTGLGLGPEGAGDISPLEKKGQIFAATASYGQGISTTPIQIVAAFGAIANGGRLMKPYIVKEIETSDGQKNVIRPTVVREVIGKRTARLVAGMMVAVVEGGHGKRAGVPGYYVAGKTGTAQIADPNGRGYLKDATIGSFVGFAPSDNPKFVMLVEIEKPKTVQFAESSAAPVWGGMAQFLLEYLQVKPERPMTAKPVPPPLASGGASSTNNSTGTTR